MSNLFPPDRSLLYPRFETYRLHPLDPSTDLSSYPLPESGATQSRVGYGQSQQQLSFKEVRDRIGWDHLAVAAEGGGARGVYVDVDWGVVGFQLNDLLEPTFARLADLPIPLATVEQQSEFPSVIALDLTHWAVSSGSGSLYILQTSGPAEESFTGKFVARYDLFPTPNANANTNSSSSSSSSFGATQASPFLLRSAHTLQEGDTRLLLTRSVRPDVGKKQIGKFQSAQSTTFELLEVKLDLSRVNGVDEGPEILQVAWALEGGDLPVWTEWSGQGWLVLSSEEFREHLAVGKEGTESEKELEKKEREAKIAKLGLGASLPPVPAPADSEGQKGEEQKHEDENMELDGGNDYPFSWTQTSDSVNVTIPLPAGTTKANIHIGFTSTSLSFALRDLTQSLAAPLESFLRRPTRSWWTSINISSSTWTFDPAKCVLELDLSKVDENTRWPSVFAPFDEDEEEEEEEEEEVPETLSASTLAAVRETFNNIRTRGMDEPEGMHPAMPALLREEMDFDLDDGEDFGEGSGEYGELSGGAGGGGKVGRDVLVGHVRGGKGTWSKSTVAVVSTPLSREGGVIIKSAVDGLRFTPPTVNSADPSRIPWSHASTTPALSFVLSSKRDLRLVRHLPSHPTTGSGSGSGSGSGKGTTTVLAFESGSSSAGQGNMYVYYPPTSKTEGKQGVVAVSGSEKGALLGVGLVRVTTGGRGKEVVVALCEKQLVVLHDIL